MSDYSQMTDEAVLEGLGDRLSRFRLDRNLTQADLAAEAGVHKNTVFRLEAGGSTQLKNLVRVLRVLGLLDRLEALVPEPVPSPLRQLEAMERQRKRAVSKADKETEESASDWSWGDDQEGDADGATEPDRHDQDDQDDDEQPGGGS
jgi:transcriptional regulator with XRE-family HTH domain